jgi:hypothetical protein
LALLALTSFFVVAGGPDVVGASPVAGVFAVACDPEVAGASPAAGVFSVAGGPDVMALLLLLASLLLLVALMLLALLLAAGVPNFWGVWGAGIWAISKSDFDTSFFDSRGL